MDAHSELTDTQTELHNVNLTLLNFGRDVRNLTENQVELIKKVNDMINQQKSNTSAKYSIAFRATQEWGHSKKEYT